jgi:ferredoxin
MKRDWTREQLEKEFVGKMKAITIPVNYSISGKQKILEMGELEEILRNADMIAQEECYCRKKMRNCIEPMDGCLSIDDEALDSIKRKKAKQITVEEALDAMKRTYDAGLVHMAYIFEGKDKVEVICSCCSCCCHSLSAALRFGYSNHVFSSKYIATHNRDNCENCGTCVERCQFGARELVDDELVFEKEKCFGCGICLDTCPEDAIEMVERS